MTDPLQDASEQLRHLFDLLDIVENVEGNKFKLEILDVVMIHFKEFQEIIQSHKLTVLIGQDTGANIEPLN